MALIVRNSRGDFLSGLVSPEEDRDRHRREGFPVQLCMGHRERTVPEAQRWNYVTYSSYL